MATPRAFPALQTLVLFNGNEFICSPNDEDRLQGGELLGSGSGCLMLQLTASRLGAWERV